MKRRGNKSRGDAFQTEVIRYLHERGWLCDEAKPCRRMISRGDRTSWITTKEDFFGAFDIVALRMEKSPVLLIQCTTDRGLLALKKRTILEAVGGHAAGRELIVVTRPIGTGGAGLEFYTYFMGSVWRVSNGSEL